MTGKRSRYDGMKELEEFVMNAKKPRLMEFVKEHMESFPGWSMGFKGDAPELLRKWNARFATAMRMRQKPLLHDSLCIKYTKEWSSILSKANNMLSLKEMVEEIGVGAVITGKPLVKLAVQKTISSIIDCSEKNQDQDGQDEQESLAPSKLGQPYPSSSKSQENDLDCQECTRPDSPCNDGNCPLFEDAVLQDHQREQESHQLDDPFGDTDPDTDLDMAVHDLAYKKKARGSLIDENDIRQLNAILARRESDSVVDALLKLGTTYLEKLDTPTNESLMKLSISRIINLMDKDMVKVYQDFMTDVEWKDVMSNSASMNLDLCTGLSLATRKLFRDVMSVGDDIDDLTAAIDCKKAELSKAKMRKSQEYLMLSIVQKIVEGFGRWSNLNEESELTLYKRFSTILDHLFDFTDVVLVDGEHTSLATRQMVQLNKALFESMDLASAYGRRIDLILVYHDHGRKQVELCTNEWKRQGVSNDVKIQQQGKNLRSNASVLTQLYNNYSHDIDQLVAMDFIGHVGYLYLMKKTSLGYFVAKSLGTVFLPKNPESLQLFEPVLDLLFKFKEFKVAMAKKVKQTICLQEIESMIQTHDTPTRNPSNSPTQGFIFFNPKAARK